MLRKISLAIVITSCLWQVALAQTDTDWGQKFEQLGPILPTANTYRTASGAREKTIGSSRLITR